MPSHEGVSVEHGDLIARFTDVCSADDRIVAAFVGGSVARGEADRYSDLDLCVIASDEAFDDVLANRSAIVQRLGIPLFLEDWGQGDPVLFAILADGTDMELFCAREGRIHELQVGPVRPLLDRRGILKDLELPLRAPRAAELATELRHILAWFWLDDAHFIAALGRDQLWWAAGEIEALRGNCVNLVRIEQGLGSEGEPYWKIDAEASTAGLEPLRPTFVPMEPASLVRAASDLVSFFGTRGRAVAAAYGLTYPAELEKLMRDRLDALVTHRGPR
jgi:predicted nucleotidyltransferase